MRRSRTSADCSPRTWVASQVCDVHGAPRRSRTRRGPSTRAPSWFPRWRDRWRRKRGESIVVADRRVVRRPRVREALHRDRAHRTDSRGRFARSPRSPRTPATATATSETRRRRRVRPRSSAASNRPSIGSAARDRPQRPWRTMPRSQPGTLARAKGGDALRRNPTVASGPRLAGRVPNSASCSATQKLNWSDRASGCLAAGTARATCTPACRRARRCW